MLSAETMRTRTIAALLPLLVVACSSTSAPPTTDGGPRSDATGTHDAGKPHDASVPSHDATRDTAVDAALVPASVLEHHGSGSRAGLYVDPAFTKAAAARLEPLPGFAFSYPTAAPSQSVFAQVLFESGAIHGDDALFVVTELDNVFALNPDTGATLWTTNVGTPATAAQLPTGCGSIDPLGITGTPIIDASSGTLYLAAMTLVAGKADYVVHALSVVDGSSKWTVDLGATVPGFDGSVQMQRGALTIAGGVLYFPFGALAGACGSPYAWVVGIPLANPAGVKAWRPKVIGAGIWGPSGVATDGTSIYVGTSENTAPNEPAAWATGNSEAILRITAGPTFSGASTDFYAPPDWFAQNEGGGQIGSSGVVLLDSPGSTPSELAFVIGKTANAALVSRQDLGGIGGHVAFLPSASADWVEGAMSAYATASSTYVAMNAPGASCPAGSDLSTIRVVAGSPPTLAAGWCARQGGHGSPIATASAIDGSGAGSDVIVWGLGTSHQGTAGNGRLTAFDGDTGAVLVQSTTTMTDVEHWISPIVANGRLYVAGDSHVYAFDLHGASRSADAGPTALPADAGPPAHCLITISGAQFDRCAPFGKTCQGNPQQSELGTCHLPTEGQACQAPVGCSTGLSCAALATADGGTPRRRCVAPCNPTTPCANLSEACTSTGGDAGFCASVGCGAYYGACTNGGAGGTCLPLYTDDGKLSGACFQAGATATNASCATATGPGGYCVTGDFCTTVNAAACLPLCNFAASAGYVDGGPSCPTGTTCTALFGSYSPAGVCAQPCGGDAGSACPGSFTCQKWSATGASACFP